MSHPHALFLAAISALALVAGCARAPSAPPHSTIPLPDASASPSSDGASSLSQWWRLYDDPALDALVQEALTQNRDLRAARAHLLEARAILHHAEGARLPQTGLSAGAGRGSTLQDQIAAAAHDGSKIRTGQRFDMGGDMAWEADVFGGLAASVRAARADGEAEAALLDGARIGVVAGVVRAWSDACGLSQQVALARDEQALARRNSEIVSALRTAGAASAVDIAAAEADEARAGSARPELEARRHDALAALAVLTGHVPADTPPAAAACSRVPLADPPRSDLDGQALLRRRPDVRAAERRLAASTARIGVAVGELYPRIVLAAGIASSATSPGALDQRNNMVWRVGPLISWSFPNVSAARAHIAQARAAEQGALARFDAAILTALQEAGEAAAELDAAVQLRAVRNRAAERSGKVADLARRSRGAGAVDAVAALSAERAALADRQALADADLKLATAQIALFRALGGGWEQAPDPALPTPIRPISARSEEATTR